MQCYTYAPSVTPRETRSRTSDETRTRRSLHARASDPPLDLNSTLVTIVDNFLDDLVTGDPSNPISPGPYDRTDRYNIRKHAPFSDEQYHKLGYPDWLVQKCRKELQQLDQFVDYINAVDGYISDAALCYHEGTGEGGEGSGKGYVRMTREQEKQKGEILDMLIEGAVQLIGELGEMIVDDVRVVLEENGVNYKEWKQKWEDVKNGKQNN